MYLFFYPKIGLHFEFVEKNVRNFLKRQFLMGAGITARPMKSAAVASETPKKTLRKAIMLKLKLIHFWAGRGRKKMAESIRESFVM